MEQVMLGLRLADGLPASGLSPAARARAGQSLADGHLDPAAWHEGRAVLTRDGRLLADALVRDLT
jgi:oxygen-independent coproporphyrinogen-3 oxidase